VSPACGRHGLERSALPALRVDRSSRRCRFRAAAPRRGAPRACLRGQLRRAAPRLEWGRLARRSTRGGLLCGIAPRRRRQPGRLRQPGYGARIGAGRLRQSLSGRWCTSGEYVENFTRLEVGKLRGRSVDRCASCCLGPRQKRFREEDYERRAAHQSRAESSHPQEAPQAGRCGCACRLDLADDRGLAGVGSGRESLPRTVAERKRMRLCERVQPGVMHQRVFRGRVLPLLHSNEWLLRVRRPLRRVTLVRIPFVHQEQGLSARHDVRRHLLLWRRAWSVCDQVQEGGRCRNGREHPSVGALGRGKSTALSEFGPPCRGGPIVSPTICVGKGRLLRPSVGLQ
jgi:hypothetical protein